MLVWSTPTCNEVVSLIFGIAILYNALNKCLIFVSAPICLWVDMAALMRKRNAPLLLEGAAPLASFDVVGVTLHEIPQPIL